MLSASDGDVCLITNDGKIVLEPKVEVDTLYYPSYGFCQVEKGGKYGYIDERGILVIPFKYENASPFSENGLAFVVGENGLGGYIDKDDQFVIDPIYETGSIFRFGFAAVSKNGEYTYIYKNGNQAIGGTFQYAGAFSECGLAKVVEFDGIHSFMDTSSRVILRMKEGFELEEFKEGSRVTKFTDGRREVLINAAGDIITRSYDKIITSPSSRFNPFLLNGLWGYLHDNGEEIIPNIYLEAAEFSGDKVALVKAAHPLAENGEWEFYIDQKDDIIDDVLIERDQQHLAQRFSHINRFKKSLALAVKRSESEMEEQQYED